MTFWYACLASCSLVQKLLPEAIDDAMQVRINEMLGPLPEYILQKAQHTNKYFRVTEMPTPAREGGSMGRSQTQYSLCSQQEFEALHTTPAPSGTLLICCASCCYPACLGLQAFAV